MVNQVRGYIAKNGGTPSSALKQSFHRIVRSDFARKVSETYFTRIFLMGLGMVSSIVVARTLGPEGRGIYAVALTVATLGIQFGNLGLHASNTYYVSQNHNLLPVLIGNSLRLSFLVGGGGGIVCWFVFRLFPQFSPVTDPLLALALCWVPVGLAYLLFQNLLIGVQDIRSYNKIEIGGRLFSLLCIFGAVYFLKPNPVAVFLAALAGTVLCFFWSYSALGRHSQERPSFSGEVFRRTISYGFKAYLNAFFAFLVLKVDLLMVKYFLGSKQTGHYSIASSMADVLYLLPSIVGSILFPKLAARKTAEEKWNLAQKAMVVVVLLMVPLASIAALLAHPAILLLYGKDYLPAVPAFWILCASMVFYAANNAISYYFASVGFPSFSVYVWIIVSFLNITLNLYLIPYYGIKGAALASLVCYSSVFFMQYIYVLLKARGLRVKRDFKKIYDSEEDPWKIGNADSDRYNHYLNLIKSHSPGSGHLLDIGCGFGAFAARLKDCFSSLTGIELSHKAIEKGKARFPFIQFFQGSADKLSQAVFPRPNYDFIVYSDVIYYLSEEGKNSSLEWIAEHLSEEGTLFLAAWTPGGRYLSHEELQRLARRYFRIESEERLETGHSIFLCRTKKRLAAITIDYETWHPIPEGMTIDWERDVFEPADQMMEMAGKVGVPLTFMVEMGEYFWLSQYHPEVARKMEEQWKKALRQGHDIQLHLHPNWLPELGAKFENGQWYWDWTKNKAQDYPEDLTGLIAKCKTTLESILKPVHPAYRVGSFRAGAYQAQPFDRLFQALTQNGIDCDTSVYAGGISVERGYDYSCAYSNHQPFWANSRDPQLQAPYEQESLVEIPVFTYTPGQRWFMDGSEGNRLAERLLEYFQTAPIYSETSEDFRKSRKVLESVQILSWMRQLFPWERDRWRRKHDFQPGAGHEYFVMIGHTKGPHDYAKIGEGLKKLRQDERFRFTTLSEMANAAKEDLRQASNRGKSELEKARQLMDETYLRLSPERPQGSNDPDEILRGGYAFCWGYAVVLGDLLKKAGYEVSWVTLLTKGHPKGRGKGQVDSHEVIQARIAGRRVLLDPMANTLIPYSLEQVLRYPFLATPKSHPDDRYRSRGYELYDTGFFYGRVFKYAVRKDPKERIWFWKRNTPKIS